MTYFISIYLKYKKYSFLYFSANIVIPSSSSVLDNKQKRIPWQVLVGGTVPTKYKALSLGPSITKISDK